MTKNCKNCVHFDNSKHALDERTKTAGICKKFYEVTFQSDNCNAHQLSNKIDVYEIEVIDPIYLIPKGQLKIF